MKNTLLTILLVLVGLFILVSCDESKITKVDPANDSTDQKLETEDPSHNAFNMKPSDFDTGSTLSEALSGDKPVIVKFYSDWCGACKRLAPYFDKARKKYSDKVEFVMVNIDTNPNLAMKYRVFVLPTVYIINPETRKAAEIPSSYIYNTDYFTMFISEYADKFKPSKPASK